MNPPRPVILMEEVARAFAAKAVLKCVSGQVEAGRVVGLLGRNGEGKTTLFHILLDMLQADSGQVEVLGATPDGSGAIRSRVGYVPERPVFHPFMSAAEVFELRSRFFPTWSAKRAETLARRLQFDADERLDGASKGTLGKVAWVCASAHDPALYLLDEPTSGLDALVREDVLKALVGELSERGKTVLVANHHMEEMAGLLDEVWLLSGGRIASRHEVESLRASSFLVTGRLYAGRQVPEDPSIVQVSASGPLRELAVFGEETAERLALTRCFENLERAPLPLETALKLLLKDTGGGPQ